MQIGPLRVVCRAVAPSVALLLGVLAAAGCGKGHPPPETLRRDITLSVDGASTPAALYPARRPRAPGLVMIHEAKGNRNDWAGLAVRLQQEGFVCLAFDRRAADGRDSEEIAGALARLITEGADPDLLGLVGAGAGAGAALAYAADHPDLQALVLVSPGSSSSDVDLTPLVRRYGRRAVLFLSSEGDAFASATARNLKDAAEGYAELREYSGAAHGADLFTTSESAREQIVDWLVTVLARPSSG